MRLVVRKTRAARFHPHLCTTRQQRRCSSVAFCRSALYQSSYTTYLQRSGDVRVIHFMASSYLCSLCSSPVSVYILFKKACTDTLSKVTICISITLTYFQLSSENYHWWWRSVVSAGSVHTVLLIFDHCNVFKRSVSIFVFFYGLFFFYARSNMSGTLQVMFATFLLQYPKFPIRLSNFSATCSLHVSCSS